MSVKYKMEFQNAQGYDCVLNFILDDDFYNGDAIPIYGGPRPFVLSEFNQDNDFFKAIRPQQATIEVLASINGVEIDDFITEDDDRQITVRFDFGPWTGYWYGILSQEDIQEQWIAQNHILTLRADEGFGVMKTVPLRDYDGNILLGTYTPYQLIQYASTETVRSFYNARIISNLFHTSMSTAAQTTGIDQCLIDAKTFEKSPGIFDDSYTVLEKINKAWNQTIFQYRGQWWIVRQEEQFIPKATNLIGFVNNSPLGGQRASINTRYMIQVGAEEKVKPIMPEMLKTFNKPSKKTSIRYAWERYSYIVCNQTFESGTQWEYTLNGSGFNSYTIDEWTWQYVSFLTPTNISTGGITESVLPYRTQVYTNYRLDDEYINIPNTVPSPTGVIATGVDTWLRSCDIYVTQYDNIDIDFQYKFTQARSGTWNLAVCAVLLYANDGTKYSLNSTTRTWSVWTNDGMVNLLSAGTKATPTEWDTFSVRYDDNANLLIQPMPKSGYINILLYAPSAPVLSNGSIRIRDLNVTITPYAQRNRRRLIAGNTDTYTIAGTFKKNTDEEIHLSDSFHVYKGAIYQTDGFTLTSGGWSRRRYPSDSYPFKQQNAIANWFQNRRYKVKLEANFYGLVWEQSGNEFPIGLVNTVNFVDDAITKTFAIVNLREIDFMACTWTANLMEIWDENEDNTVQPGAFDTHSNENYYE